MKKYNQPNVIDIMIPIIPTIEIIDSVDMSDAIPPQVLTYRVDRTEYENNKSAIMSQAYEHMYKLKAESIELDIGIIEYLQQKKEMNNGQ